MKDQYEGKENKNDNSTNSYGGLFSKEEVQKARHKLSEMEHKLFNEVKRQRLAVAASDLHTKSDMDDVLDSSKVPDELQLQQLAPNSQDATAQQSHHGDNAMGDASASDDVDRERGSRRPAPVNSDKLPLPWNGRLGYVSIFWIREVTANRLDPLLLPALPSLLFLLLFRSRS